MHDVCELPNTVARQRLVYRPLRCYLRALLQRNPSLRSAARHVRRESLCSMICMSAHSPASPAMDSIGRLVRSRRSIRQFEDRQVPRTVIAEIVQDAVWAPSPHNSQPWRFTALFERSDRHGLAEAMAARLQDELRRACVAEEGIKRQTARSVARIDEAPVAIVLSLVTDGLVTSGDRRLDALEWEMAVQSVGAVLQTLFLVAAARGLGSCWMAAPMYCPDVVRACVGLPEEYEPQALALSVTPRIPARCGRGGPSQRCWTFDDHGPLWRSWRLEARSGPLSDAASL